MSNELFYSVDDRDPFARIEFPKGVECFSGSRLVEKLAADFYDNHDGWECKWPVEFHLWHGDKIVSTYGVELEFVTTFYARVADNG